MKQSVKSLCCLAAIIFIFTQPELKAQLYWNQAASLAGNSASYVSVPNSSSLNITGSITLEAVINPSNNTGSKGIIAKGGALGTSLRYGLRYFNSRIFFLTNGASRISSKTSTVIPLNDWTHVAVTLDSATSQCKVYINGILDTSAVVPGALPLSNTDSLFIGISGNSTPFAGKMDYVRVWNTALNSLNVDLLSKSSLGISGISSSQKLVLSIPFQNNTGEVPYLSFKDHSPNENNGNPRNVTAFDLSDIPSDFSQYNDCAVFSGSVGVFMAADEAALSPTNKLTIELWVFPKGNNMGLIYKGHPQNFYTDYGLYIENARLKGSVNSNIFTAADSIKTERWTHIAFTYFGSTGRYEFFINGKPSSAGNIAPANINNGPDSLVIGAFPAKGNFNGFMDELRISSTVKTSDEINSQMFSTINESKDNDSYSNAVYSFDATELASTSDSKRLRMFGNVGFTFNGGFTSGYVQSPVINFTSLNFHSGFYLSMPNKRIPATGGTGIVRDTIEILSPDLISDINVFVAINHSFEENLKISITSPLGATTDLYTNHRLIGFNSNIITVFDNTADSSLKDNAYLSFAPKIKPLNDINAIFSGNSAKGKWILTVNDESGSDTGFFSAWGIQINNTGILPSNLECTSYIEGFYNAGTNLIITDTVKYFIHSSVPPFNLIDSAKSLTNNTGRSVVPFYALQPGTNYFLVLKHRNSIETWSSTVINFNQFTKQATYNFTNSQSKAFGNNMKQVDASPLSFAVYSGDENQNGIVDLTDVVNVSNAASSFISGYVPSDMNGDNITDLNDLVITSNNASAFVSKLTP